MTSVWLFLFLCLLGAVVSALLVWYLTRRWRENTRIQCENQLFFAEKEAEIIARETRNKTENELDKKRAEVQQEMNCRRLEIAKEQQDVDQVRQELSKVQIDIEAQKNRIDRERAALKQGREAVRNMVRLYRRRLEGLSELTSDEAKKQLRDEVSVECQDEIRRLRRGTMERLEKEVQHEAKGILVATIQRLASQPINDITATLVALPNDEMKGRIIGREGRNIKCFESTTGVTILIDESPQTVLISSFDPIRREVAKIALERLIQDGRIHPASIEETVAEAQTEVNAQVIQYGGEAVDKLGLVGVHPEILTLIGKLKYRYSFTQNALGHSIEVSHLSSMLASELGLDPVLAKRAGLFHDIGKAISHEYEGSHAIIGAEFLKRYGEDPIVINAVAAHHEEVPLESMYAGLLIAADSLSAIRPGARAESQGAYIERIERLERLAAEIDGVYEAYAIQAGREIRVLVQPSAVSEEGARKIARVLRQKIEDELQYPSTIKIIVIREQRFTETAK